MDNKKKGLYGLGALVVLGAITIFASRPLYEMIDNAGTKKANTTVNSDGGASGTYTGTAQGFGGEVVATVVMNSGVIESVVFEGAGETPGIGSLALEQLPAMIEAAQSADVDAITSATVTSEAAIEAVKAALAHAGDSAASGASGTYTGTAQGFGGEVVATVVMNSGVIESVVFEGTGETPGIGSLALEQLPAIIEAAQSADVDVIASATVTSEAAIEAVKAALNSAQ